MKALVTGGAGFIGSSMVERLLDYGAEVVVLDNFMHGNKLPKEIIDKINIIEGDVTDKAMVMTCAKGVDYIFHFASILGVDVVAKDHLLTMQSEVEGMNHITSAALLNNCAKIVYASTSGVYGKVAIDEAVTEDFNVSPSSSYAIGKRYNEIFLKAFYQEKGIESVSMRYFNVYGARQDNRMVIPRFFDAAMKGNPLVVFGDGSQTRDFTYIDDTVEATFLCALKSSGAEVVNVAAGREFSILDLAKEIIEITNSKSEIEFRDVGWREDFEVLRRVGSSKKLETITNFRPSFRRKAGLEKIYQEYVNT